MVARFRGDLSRPCLLWAPVCLHLGGPGTGTRQAEAGSLPRPLGEAPSRFPLSCTRKTLEEQETDSCKNRAGLQEMKTGPNLFSSTVSIWEDETIPEMGGSHG